MSIHGMKIIEDSSMVVDGEPYEIRRNWVERIFSFPWNPWKSTRTVIIKVPDKEAIVKNGTLIMHPETAKELKRMFDERRYYE